MTWTDIKYIHAGQFSPTEKTCSVTLDQTIEIEKEWCNNEDQGRFDHISLEEQTRSLNAD